jgi:hypothetical protein
MLFTKNAGDRRVYWQGPSLGFDFGGDGARTMMLVYDLPATDAIYQRFVGVEGSAYFVGGLGMTALSFNNIVVVPVRSGVGLRLGANVGYLKFTPTSTGIRFKRDADIAKWDDVIPMAVAPALYRNVGYDPIKSFAPVVMIARSHQIFHCQPCGSGEVGPGAGRVR